MKTQLTILVTALLGLFINAASAEAPDLSGNVGLEYSSQHYFRGQSVSTDTLQASIGADFDVAGLGAFVDFSTNQSLDVGDDKQDASVGVQTSFLDESISVSVGLFHYEYTEGAAELEGFVGATYNTTLSPTVRLYRNTDEGLSTYEASISHNLDLGVADLRLGAGIGVTDLTTDTDSDYYEVSAVASRSLSDNINIFGAVSYNDADNRSDSDTFGGFGLSVKF
jgi:outer membrane usher protein FimD/PapC